MIVLSQDPENIEIFEFQGVFENIELFDGQYDKETLQMSFKTFTLQGKRVKKDFTVIEKNEKNFTQKAKIQEVILFDQPPKFRL